MSEASYNSIEQSSVAMRKAELKPKTYVYSLLWNVHLEVPLPKALPSVATHTCYTTGDVAYYHYGCDGQNDSGWGCAYRTLQSMCSWVLRRRQPCPDQIVPSIHEIQETLVNVDDKPASFVGSRDWIGALEVFYVVDALYDVPCKILHINKQDDLKDYGEVLRKYFEDFGGFLMMGGDKDANSKGIAGLHISGNDMYLLVVDPHFVGVPKSAADLISLGYIRWQHASEFVDSSFYNICLPQLKI